MTVHDRTRLIGRLPLLFLRRVCGSLSPAAGGATGGQGRGGRWADRRHRGALRWPQRVWIRPSTPAVAMPVRTTAQTALLPGLRLQVMPP